MHVSAIGHRSWFPVNSIHNLLPSLIYPKHFLRRDCVRRHFLRPTGKLRYGHEKESSNRESGILEAVFAKRSLLTDASKVRKTSVECPA